MTERSELTRAVQSVRARACQLEFNRIVTEGDHLVLRTHGTKPYDFACLQSEIHSQMDAENVGDQWERTAHITLSYRTPIHLEKSFWIEPIPWTLDEIQLVAGGGAQYAYTVLERQRLAPPIQRGLFA